MAYLFRKFQEAVKVLAKSPTFARDPRHLQYEADINRLFLYTSYKRLGRNADEHDADEIIDMATKSSVADQEKQVQDNIHCQIKSLCNSMDEILLPHPKNLSDSENLVAQPGPRRSGLSFAVGKTESSKLESVVPETRPLNRTMLSQSLKQSLGYTLDVKPSQIPHEEAGQGLFLTGEPDVGAVIAFYPGVIYSPAYYRYIPGYPRVDASNSYLITRYDGHVINAQPWGTGSDTREAWDGVCLPEYYLESNSDRIWKFLSKPAEGSSKVSSGEVLERRNPLAFGHFANHPAKGMTPNVMVCPYNFPLSEKNMRPYIPNIVFGGENSVRMKRLGTFWFKLGGSLAPEDGPVIKTLVLVATRTLCDEEILLNYRLSNSKRRPAWYVPIDEEEDRRRWG